MKKIVSIMLSVIMVMSLLPLNVLTVSASEFAGGDGSLENPYQISTVEQLDAIRNDLDACYILVNDIDLSTTDEWVPIGNNENYFSGYFDGGNCTISNMKITDSSYDALGLFGVSDKNSTIKNIKLSNIEINITKTLTAREELYIGGILGNYVTLKYPISNCQVSGQINVMITNHKDGQPVIKIGGIAGYGAAEKSINKANITVNTSNDSICHFTVGGIIGSARTLADVPKNINYGNIDVVAGESLICGGIIGSGGGLEYCINYGNINGKVINSDGGDDCRIGGIVGSNANYIKYTANMGDIVSYIHTIDGISKTAYATTSYAGGVIGNGNYSGLHIDDCVNASKKIYAYRPKSNSDSSLIYSQYVGRIAGGGINKSTVDSDCYSVSDTLVNGQYAVVDDTYPAHGQSKDVNFVNKEINKIFSIIKGIPIVFNSYTGNFSYLVDDDGNAIITKIIESDESGTISIPTEIDGYKVVAIDEYCIPDSANIKRITIPSTITHIDENAFNGYDGIEIIYYFNTEDDWIEITDGIHYISDDTELVYVMDDVENTEISDYSKPEKKKDNDVNFTNAIRDWEKEKNDWIDTLVKVVNNIKDDISISNKEAINNNYEKNKERIDAMIADEGWYQSGSDSARDAAFRAVYDMIADWGEESISLDKVDPSSDVVDFSTRIVKNVINGMKNQTIEKDYGDYTVLITVSGISTGLFENPAFTGSVTVKHKNGKTFGPALINSTVDDTKQVMSDYMLQLKELEENTVEMAMETYVSDLISLTDSKLPLDTIKEKLDSASEIINDTLEEKGLGNLNNFIGGVIDVFKSTKEVIELQNGGDTDALIRAVADLDSKLDFLSGESTTATSATLDWAYKNLKQKTKYLKEVTESYIDGKEIPEYESTWDKMVGWFDKHIFQCPVEVYVYNENGELIGCVSDEQIFGDTEEIYVEKNGDTKTVYVAEGTNVHFKLIGTDIGNLDYVSETYSENKVVGRTNFYGIELYDGKEITAETTDETAPNNCNEIILQSNGETINTTEYLKAADNASVLIEGNVVGSGTVVGTGWYARGDSVTLVASPDEGYVFKGWYNGDIPITFNANYTFCAKDFIEVTAKFEKYEENYSVSIPASESFKTIYDISADSDEDNVYFYVKELSEEANASKLNLYLAEYETSGKLSTLKIADIKVDSNGTVIFTTPYPQLEDFKIMLWTNNITPVIDVLN